MKSITFVEGVFHSPLKGGDLLAMRAKGHDGHTSGKIKNAIVCPLSTSWFEE